MGAVDWTRYPSLLDVHHVAEIYVRKVAGVRRAVWERSKKLPTPCQTRPYKFRRDDVKRHFERLEA